LRTAIPGVTYVAVSTDGRRELAALLGVPKAQIEIVPNGVDPAAFLRLTPTGRWLAAALRLWEQQVVLLLPVRITRRKQIEYALILPSRREGFGLPLLEAALARLPAWTSDLPPLREVGGDAIHTFDLADPPAAVALRLIHTLMEERGYRLRRRVLASYTWEGIMRERIIPLLTRLVGAARP